MIFDSSKPIYCFSSSRLSEMTIHDEMDSRNQRYRLTRAGREFLRQTEEKQ